MNSPQSVFSVAAPGYFRTMRIPLREGRDFDDRDSPDATPVAIINEELAQKSFPHDDPIGKRIKSGFDPTGFMTVIGVVGDVRQLGPAVAPWPEIYLPFRQHWFGSDSIAVVLRTAGEPDLLTGSLRRMVRELSPDVPVKFTTMDAALAGSVATPRFRTLLFSIFAGLAVCLAMAGVYGVMAYVVSQRCNEIGLRMALGASTGDVLRLVLGQGLTLAAIGMVLGLAGAMAATRLLTAMLFEVKPADPLTYVAVALLLGMVTLAACYVPARRATKVDPLVALRQE
jgi:predicted permease